MRRLVLAAAVATVIVGPIVLLTRGGAETFRVDAMFDTANGVVAGQNVKIAGTKVGEIAKVKLIATPGGGYKARLSLDIEDRFSPFRADATCRILPEGLISENYVDCDPGVADRPLRAPGGVQRVALARTQVPLSLQDVLDTFQAPADQMLRVVVNELGLATAGRGEDINAILRRANPALRRAQGVLSILDAQRERVGEAVRDTDLVLAEIADRRDDVRGFVRHAAAVSDTTAAHSDDIREGLRRLPRLLGALDRSLTPLRAAARAGTPLLRQLEAGAPQLTRATREVPAFATAAVPALDALRPAVRDIRRALRPTRRVARHLREFAPAAERTAGPLQVLFTSLRDTGGHEFLLKMIYGLTASVATYDQTSHHLIVLPLLYPGCVVSNSRPGTQVTPGCSHAYTAPGLGRIPASDVPPPNARTTTRAAALKPVRDLLDYLLG